jgi:hypothetical protein
VLHVTNGDAVVPEIAAVLGDDPAEIVPWRDVLHDGPVPAGLDPAELAAVRAAHLARRGWAQEDEALADMLARDERLRTHPAGEEIVLWFEHDLFDSLQLAQVADRLAGGEASVSLVGLRHPPRGDLASGFAARRTFRADPRPFAALRSPDPTAWQEFGSLSRLVEELPDSETGLSRLEREILESLETGPLSPSTLFVAVARRERPPWLGDAPLWAVADDLAPLVERQGEDYAITDAGQAVLTGAERRPPIDRWLGGVHLSPDTPAWAWDAVERRIVSAP